jgi:hypothetical protein
MGQPGTEVGRLERGGTHHHVIVGRLGPEGDRQAGTEQQGAREEAYGHVAVRFAG